MSETILLTLPNDPALRAEIESKLAPYGGVYVPEPKSFELNEIKLMLEAFTLSVGLVKALLEVQQMLRQKGHTGARISKAGYPETPLDTADEALLRALLDVPEE